MKPTPAKTLQPRKTPSQARSAVTVDTIFEASIQVLLADGYERLTTTRVAERAGVSVGTLYQYFPNKQALLAGVLERHLTQVVTAIEQACEQQHGQPLATMVKALVHAFIDAKMDRPEVSKALYGPSSELDGAAVVGRMTLRAQQAVCAMAATASDAQFADLPMTSLMLLTASVGPVQTVLELGASPDLIQSLRKHLVVLCQAYLNEMSTPRAPIKKA
jgi:AcrR family transcriptional regulator